MKRFHLHLKVADLEPIAAPLHPATGACCAPQSGCC